jgi:uncharacterized protein (DUF58 family)
MLPFDPSELVRYGGLTLVARTIVEGFLSGTHHSRFEGLSAEFAGHRPYSTGDELRRVDWRASGKTDRFFVKEFERESNLKTFLVLDASGSMRYRGQQAVTKFEYAQRVAASLAYLMLAQRDAVGLIVHDTRIRQLIQPRATSKHLLGLLRGLETIQPGGETGLAEVWHDIAIKHLKRPGLVVLISDGFDDPARLAQAFRAFRHRKHIVRFFQILATEEIDFPFDRLTRFRNMEQLGEVVRVDARRLRSEYRANFETYCATLRRQALDLQIDYHLLRTDEPVDRALGVYLAGRKGSRKPGCS